MTVDASGDVWQLLPYYSNMWVLRNMTYILIRPVSNNVWNCLCIETCAQEVLALRNGLYERVA